MIAEAGGQAQVQQEFRNAVGSSEDAITQLECDGEAIRKQIARAETAEKLAEVENECMRLSNKKNIT